MIAMEDERLETGLAARSAQSEILITTEQQQCPSCESVIPPTCIKGSTIDFEVSRKTARCYQIYCPHCSLGFRAVYVVVSGQPQRIGAIERLDGGDLAAFRDEIAALAGERRLAPVPPPPAPPPPHPRDLTRGERHALRARLIGQVRSIEHDLMYADVVDQQGLADAGQENRYLAQVSEQIDAAGAVARQIRREETAETRIAPRAPHGSAGCCASLGGVPTPPEVAYFQPADVERRKIEQQQQQQIADEMDQRSAWSESEPGRDYME